MILRDHVPYLRFERLGQVIVAVLELDVKSLLKPQLIESFSDGGVPLNYDDPWWCHILNRLHKLLNGVPVILLILLFRHCNPKHGSFPLSVNSLEQQKFPVEPCLVYLFVQKYHVLVLAVVLKHLI